MKDRKQYMAIVQENTELLLQLISDILDLSKMESGAFEFVKSDTDVNLLCSEIIRSLRMKVPAGVELVFEECLPGCHVWADKNRLNQVISNFINNALKFTFSGSITLGYYRQTDGYLRFYVRDTGMGIPKNKIKTVFDRFVKLNSFVMVRDLACLFVRVWWNRWVELSVWSQKKEKALAFGLLILIRKWLVVFWYRRGV